MAQEIAYRRVSDDIARLGSVSKYFNPLPIPVDPKDAKSTKKAKKTQKTNRARANAKLHSDFVQMKFNVEDAPHYNLSEHTHSSAHALYVELCVCPDKITRQNIADSIVTNILGLNLKSVSYRRAKAFGGEITFIEKKLKEKDILFFAYNDYTQQVQATMNRLIDCLTGLNKRQGEAEHNDRTKKQCYEIIHHLHRYQNLDKLPLADKEIINPKVYEAIASHRQWMDTYYRRRFAIIGNTIDCYLNNPAKIMKHKLLSKIPGYQGELDQNTLGLLEKLNFLGGKKIISDYYDAYFNRGHLPHLDPRDALNGFLQSLHNNVLELQEKNLKPYGITKADKKQSIVMALKKEANRLSRENHLNLRLIDVFQTRQYIDKSIALLQFCESSYIAYFTQQRLKAGSYTIDQARQYAQNKYNTLLLKLKSYPSCPAKYELEELSNIHDELCDLYHKHLSDEQLLKICEQEYKLLYCSDAFNHTIKGKMRDGSEKEKKKARKTLQGFFEDHFEAITRQHDHHGLINLDEQHDVTRSDYFLASAPAKPMGYKEHSFRKQKKFWAIIAYIVSKSIAAGQGGLGYFALTTILGLAPLAALGVAISTFVLNDKLFYKDTLDTLVQIFVKGDVFNGFKSLKGKITMGGVLSGAIGMSAVMGGLTFVAVMGVEALPFALALGIGTYLAATSFAGFLGLMYVAFANVVKKALNFGKKTWDSIQAFVKRDLNESNSPIKYLHTPVWAFLKATVYSLLEPLTPKNDYTDKVLREKLHKTKQKISRKREELKGCHEEGQKNNKLDEIKLLEARLRRLTKPSFKQLWLRLRNYWKNPLDFNHSSIEEKIAHKEAKKGRKLTDDEETAIRAKVEKNHNAKAHDMIREKEKAEQRELSKKEKDKIEKNISRKENVKRSAFILGHILEPFFIATAGAMLIAGTVFTLLGWQPQFVDFLHTWIGLYEPAAQVISGIFVFGFCLIVDGAFNLLNEMSFFAWANTQTANALAHVGFAVKDTFKAVCHSVAHPMKTFRASIEEAKEMKKQTSAAFTNAWDNPRKYVLPLMQFIFVDLVWNFALLVANAAGFAALSVIPGKSPIRNSLSFSSVLVASVSCNTITGVIPAIKSRTPNCSDKQIREQLKNPDEPRDIDARDPDEDDAADHRPDENGDGGFKKTPAQRHHYQQHAPLRDAELHADKNQAGIPERVVLVGY